MEIHWSSRELLHNCVGPGLFWCRFSPPPPCVIGGGWSTKQSKVCRQISIWSARNNSDFLIRLFLTLRLGYPVSENIPCLLKRHTPVSNSSLAERFCAWTAAIPSD